MHLTTKDRLLFLGDSITDAGRDRHHPEDLGRGFVLMTAAELGRRYPQLQLSFLNRGIGGDRIQQILDRLETDCLALSPDILIFMIGINDTWHQTDDPNNFGTQQAADQFHQKYESFLKRVKAAGIQRILLLEPFVLPWPADRIHWRQDLDPKIQTVRRLAAKYECELVPLDGLLNSLGIRDGFAYYTGNDGVHPTLVGHQVIAHTLLQHFTA